MKNKGIMASTVIGLLVFLGGISFAHAQAPTVSNVAASNITSTSATINGFYDGNGLSTITYFQWGVGGSLNSTTPAVLQTSTTGVMTSNLTGLTPNTQYSFRAVASNQDGTTFAITAYHFTTAGIIVSPCTINSFSASPNQVTSGNSSTLSWSTSNCTSASISPFIGNITNPNSGSMSTGALSNTTTFTLYASGNGASPQTTTVVTVISGTSSCTINYFNASQYTVNSGNSSTLSWSASNCIGLSISGIGNVGATGSISTGALFNTTIFILSDGFGGVSSSVTINVSGTTNGSAPTAVTNSATSITEDSAHLRGSVDPNGDATDIWFEWGTGSNLNHTTNTQSIGSGTSSQTVSFNLYNLSSGTTYSFRVCATNSFGDDCGSRLTFTTEDNSDNGGCTDNCNGGCNTGCNNNCTNNNCNNCTTNCYNDNNCNCYPAPQVINTGYVYTPPTTYAAQPSPTITYITTNSGSQNTTTTAPVNTTSDLVSLKITTPSEMVNRGDDISFNVSYQNISNTTLKNAVLTVSFPREITFRQATSGLYDGNVLTIKVGTLAPNDSGNLTIETVLSENPSSSQILVTTAKLDFTHGGKSEEAVAYAFNKVSGNSALAGLALFGSNSFLPHTFFQWLLLILLVLALILLSRKMFAPKKPELHGHAPAH